MVARVSICTPLLKTFEESFITCETAFIKNEGDVFVDLLPLDARIGFSLGLELAGELGVCGGQHTSWS